MKLIHQLKEKYRSFSAPVKASFWALACSVFQSAFSLFTTPVFTRILSQEEYGVYDQYNTWLGILGIILTLNLSYETFLKGLADHKDDEDSYVSVIIGLDMAVFLFFFLLFLISPSFWGSLFKLSPLLTFLMFVHIFVSNPLDFWKSKERFHYRYIATTVVSVLLTVFSYAFSIYAVTHFNNRMEARIEADLLVRVLIGLPILVILLIQGKKIYDRKIWLSSLRFALPLLPHYLSNILLNSSDRLMIGRMVGDAQVAKYSIAYMIASMVLMICSAVENSFVPYCFQKLKTKEYDSIRKNSRPLFICIALLCLGAMGLAPEVITIFAGNRYADAVPIVPTVSASVYFIFVYTMFSNVEYHYSRTEYVGAATLAAAVLNIVLNWIMIPLFDYKIAGATTLISYIFLALTHYISYRHIQKTEQFPGAYDLPLIFGIGAALTASAVLMNFIYPYMILRWLIVILSVAGAGIFYQRSRTRS